MRNGHRKAVLAGALAICALFLLGRTTWRYALLGWLRNEPFYRGMPASYWRARFVGFDDYWDRHKREWETENDLAWRWYCFRDMARERLSPILGKEEQLELPDVSGPDAIPVLIVLLIDEDARVAFRGEELRAIPEAVPALINLLKDSNPRHRAAAIPVLCSLAESANGVIPALREATKDVDPEVAQDAADALESIEDRRSGLR